MYKPTHIESYIWTRAACHICIFAFSLHGCQKFVALSILFATSNTSGACGMHLPIRMGTWQPLSGGESYGTDDQWQNSDAYLSRTEKRYMHKYTNVCVGLGRTLKFIKRCESYVTQEKKISGLQHSVFIYEYIRISLYVCCSSPLKIVL